MAENRPASPDRKLGLIAPLTIAIVVALLLLGVVLLRDRNPPAAPAPPAPPPAATVVSDPPGEAILNRTEFLKEAAAISAGFAATGEAPVRDKDPMLGRAFQIRIPFGCDGPQTLPGAAQAYYEFDAAKRTIRLVARPAVWTTLPLVQELEGGDIEYVEGFWLQRPWTYSDACPVRRDAPVPASPSPAAAQTLGLARLSTAGASRVARRGDRPYEHVLRLEEGQSPPLSDGYRLALSGRFDMFPGGRVARCWSESPDHRPVCLYAVALERVAFEAADGRTIAEWRD